MTQPAGGCLHCAHRTHWMQACRCADPCGYDECPARSTDDLYDWGRAPVPRFDERKA